MKNICPICFFDGLYEPPYNSRGSGSYEICPCCGFQFGYDDYPDKEKQIKEWRQRWVLSGYPWFSPRRNPPAGWTPTEQLKAFLNPDTESDTSNSQ